MPSVTENDNPPQVEVSESPEDGKSIFERHCLNIISNSFKSHHKKILVFSTISVIVTGSTVMINNRLLSRKLKSQFQVKNKSILAISNVFDGIDSDLQKRRVLIDYNGDLNYNFNFSTNIPSINHLEDDTWDNSCPALLNGEFYMIRNHIIFDESENYNFAELYFPKSSVFKIKNCGIELIDTLFISFLLGSCGTFLFPEQRIFLCFGEWSRKKCVR